MKKTIGQWAEETGANIRNNAHWTLCRDSQGTFASVRMKVLVLKNGSVIGYVDLGPVARGETYPHNATWEQDSPEVKAANTLLTRMEETDTSGIPVRRVWGLNRALPWEVPHKAKPWWRRLLAWVG